MEAAMADPSSPPGFNDFALSGKIMLSAIIILLFVVILIICLHLYARWYVLRARRRGTLRRRNRLIFYFEPNPPSSAAVSVSQQRGLDSSVLDSLPVFNFSSKSHSDPVDCAVCLSEFEENEKGRTLPKCGHSFHIECIDMWFHSHDTCPLCRSPVERVLERPAEVAVSMEEPGSSSCAECDRSDRMASSSAGSQSFRSRRKPVELAGVSIEIPRRSDGEFAAAVSPSSLTPSFKSPISRVMSLSFKRIIGRERRGGASPSGNAVGCSSGAGGELDVEKGKESAQ